MYELATMLYWATLFLCALSVMNTITGMAKVIIDQDVEAGKIHVLYGMGYGFAGMTCGMAGLAIVS